MNKKNTILEVAAKLFSQKGFKETPMTEISKLTGAAEGTIFYHFKNKEELFVAILEDFKGKIIEDFKHYEGQAEYSTGLEMLEGVISFYFHLAATMEDRFLLLHRHDLYELAEVNSVCRGHLEEIFTCFLDIIEQAVSRGQEDGSIRKTDTRKMAWIIFSMVDGLVRFNTFRLYEAGALYNELIESCRRMLQNPQLGKAE
ncbi:MAG: TetR/AcrR family transcriptional regulator [Desulfobacterota bacterium]|nr:TetR/AcrR family transcriptional regulator [Thermodesulfobacteriota bacterium]